MIGALNGTVIERRGETVVLDVSGVGYEVTASAAALQSIGKDGRLRLTVYTDVKETSISLYGFAGGLEKEVFLLLRKVKGIGSKIALAIVSSIGAEGVLRAIGQNDMSRLRQIPGIGGKTAERIVVELRENVSKFAQEAAEESITGGVAPPPAGLAAGAEADVVLALEKLGFPLERARLVVTSTLKKHAAEVPALKADPGELLRLSLGNIV